MTATQRAIIPGMLASFWLGKIETFMGIDTILILLVLFVLAATNLYLEHKRAAKKP